MNNTIHNVPRELLEEVMLAAQRMPVRGPSIRAKLHALLSAPSPAGVYSADPLACPGCASGCFRCTSPAGVDDDYAPEGLVQAIMQSEVVDVASLAAKSLKAAGVDGWDVAGDILEKLSAAQAIIDGLRGEVATQEETANQWRELALQFDRHRMTAMAHIRAAASGDKSAIEALGVFAALPPIPGHEITAAHERQAQRIGELDGLLRACHSALYPFDNKVLESEIAAALSAGKDSDQ